MVRRNNMRRGVALVVSVLFSHALPTIAFAQGVETLLAEQGAKAIGSELLSKKISDIINQLRAAGASLIGQAANEGNGLAARLGNEMNIAAINASNAFAGQLDRTVAQASAETQPILAALNYVATNHKKLLTESYRIKDTMVMDLRAVSWRLTGEHFFVQTIEGAAQSPRSAGTYRVSVRGTGLGIPTATLRSESTLRLLGRTYTPTPPTDPHTATFEIPVADLTSSFKPNKLAVVKATFRTKQQVKGWIFWSERAAPDVDLNLGLYPALYATVVIQATTTAFEWRKARDEQVTKGTADHNCARCPDPPKTPYTLEIVVPNQGKAIPQLGDQQLRSARMECLTDVVQLKVPGPFLPARPGPNNTWLPAGPTYSDLFVDRSACGWTSSLGVTSSNNNSRAEGKLLAWGSPTNWRMTAEVWEFQAVGENREVLPAQDVNFGSIVEFEAPSVQGSTAIGIGTTYSNEKFEFVLGNNTEMLILQ